MFLLLRFKSVRALGLLGPAYELHAKTHVGGRNLESLRGRASLPRTRWTRLSKPRVLFHSRLNRRRQFQVFQWPTRSLQVDILTDENDYQKPYQAIIVSSFGIGIHMLGIMLRGSAIVYAYFARIVTQVIWQPKVVLNVCQTCTT